MAWLLSRPAISEYTTLCCIVLYSWLEKEPPEPPPPPPNPPLVKVDSLQSILRGAIFRGGYRNGTGKGRQDHHGMAVYMIVYS